MLTWILAMIGVDWLLRDKNPEVTCCEEKKNAKFEIVNPNKVKNKSEGENETK